MSDQSDKTSAQAKNKSASPKKGEINAERKETRQARAEERDDDGFDSEKFRLRVKVEMDKDPAFGPEPKPELDPEDKPTATRSDLQVGRRLFHIFNGVGVATAYAFFFTHQQTIYVLGTLACLAYIFEKIRIAYPEIAGKVSPMTNFLLRAEEQAKESSMIPYAMGILLSLLTFPKPIALIAIYTLALADPMAAVMGITYGKHEIAKGKSIEGSLAFFSVTFAVAFTVLYFMAGGSVNLFAITMVCILVSVFATAFEALPIRIDDNLTIPLFVGFITWICALMYGLPI